MAADKTVFFLYAVRKREPQMAGESGPACGSWNTLVEQPTHGKSSSHRQARTAQKPHPLNEITKEDVTRGKNGHRGIR